MRYRRHEDSNYFALFNEGITVRFAIEPHKPILPLKYPEIEDVSLGTLCYGGCSYCYANSSCKGVLYKNALNNIIDYYGNLDDNNKPFQVAIGGGGEPTLHPDFGDILLAFREFGIVPNYTTNGMHITNRIIESSRLAGGAAISCHPHLKKYWLEAIDKLHDVTEVSLHIIIGDEGSSDRFWNIYRTVDKVSRFVALPYQCLGRARKIDVKHEWDIFFAEVSNVKPDNIAFGAGFYGYFVENMDIAESIGVSLYEPEILSGYRIMDDDSYKCLRKSSYDPFLRNT